LRVLLDENVPHDLRSFLYQHDVVTVAYAGFAGLKNGELLATAERAAFEVLVTGDKTLHHEQNLVGRPIAVVALSAVNWPVIEPHIAKIAAAVDAATPGSFTRVECGGFVRPGRRPKGPM
jgi:predicted nuclease of predicted toxin-antitoxin system